MVSEEELRQAEDQVAQNRQQVEDRLKSLRSQQALRNLRSREALNKRESGLRTLNQASQEISSQEQQVTQARTQFNRQNAINKAISLALGKGKYGSEFRSLSKSDQQKVKDLVKGIKFQAEKKNIARANNLIEKALGKKLTSEEKASIAQQVREGSPNITLPKVFDTTTRPIGNTEELVPQPANLADRRDQEITREINILAEKVRLNPNDLASKAKLTAAVAVRTAGRGGRGLVVGIKESVTGGGKLPTREESAFAKAQLKSQIEDIRKVFTTQPEIGAGIILGNLALEGKGRLVGKALSGITKSIGAEEIASKPIGVIGNERNKFVAETLKVYADDLKSIGVDTARVKSTGVQVYDIPLKSGSVYRIVDFTNELAGKLGESIISTGKKGIYGFKLTPDIRAPGGLSVGERFAAGTRFVTKDDITQAYTEAIRFQRPKNKLTQLLSKLTGRDRAEFLSLVEQGKIVAKGGKGKLEFVSTEGESRILNRNIAKAEQLQKAIELDKKIGSGKRISSNDILDVFNLERRSQGLEPFTKEEFLKASNPTSVKNNILRILNKLEVSKSRELKGANILEKLTVDARRELLGKAKISTLAEPERLVEKSKLRPMGKLKSFALKTEVQGFFEKQERISKSKVPKVKLKKPKSLISGREMERPTIVGGKGQRSSFTGRGAEFERENLEPLISKRGNRGVSATVASIITAERTGRKVTVPSLIGKVRKKELVRGRAGLRGSINSRQNDSQVFKSAQDTRQRMKQDQGQKGSQIFKQPQALRFSQVNGQRNRQAQVQRNRTPTRTGFSPRIRNPVPFKRSRFKTGFKKVKSSAFKRRPAKFDVFTRKGKRLNPIPLSRKSAFGLGARFSDVGLKASFFIRKTNRPGFVRSRELEREGARRAFKFRPSKRTKGLVVEKNRFRLEKGGRTRETREIKAFRKRGRSYIFK